MTIHIPPSPQKLFVRIIHCLKHRQNLIPTVKVFIVLDSDVTDATFPTSADADVRLLTSADADADLHNPKQNDCAILEFSEI